jgi:hypothetical protein
MYVESGIKHHNPNPTFQYITYQLHIDLFVYELIFDCKYVGLRKLNKCLHQLP